MLHGIDFAYGNGLTTAEITAAGNAFVCRYLSTPGNSKNIDALELENYGKAGIAVVFCFETSGTDMFSYGQGVKDAQSAQWQLNTLQSQTGLPGVGSAPVFFAADEQTEIDETDYLRGATSVIGLPRTGIYGGIGSIKRAFDGKLVTYGWQTYAWSAGLWDNRALLRQVQNGVPLGPATVDLDEAAYWATPLPILDKGDDFGQYPTPPKSDPDAVKR